MNFNNGLVAALVLAAGPVIAFAQSMMTITLSGKYIPSSSTRVIEIYDVNCDQNRGTFTLSGNQTISISVCKNDSGYGNIRYRNVTNNGPWVGASLLSDGAEVSP